MADQDGPSPKSPLPWAKKRMQMEHTRAGRYIERFAVVDANGITVFEQVMMTEDAEATIDYVLGKANAPEGVLVPELERQGK